MNGAGGVTCTRTSAVDAPVTVTLNAPAESVVAGPNALPLASVTVTVAPLTPASVADADPAALLPGSMAPLALKSSKTVPATVPLTAAAADAGRLTAAVAQATNARMPASVMLLHACVGRLDITVTSMRSNNEHNVATHISHPRPRNVHSS